MRSVFPPLQPQSPAATGASASTALAENIFDRVWREKVAAPMRTTSAPVAPAPGTANRAPAAPTTNNLLKTSSIPPPQSPPPPVASSGGKKPAPVAGTGGKKPVAAPVAIDGGEKKQKKRVRARSKPERYEPKAKRLRDDFDSDEYDSEDPAASVDDVDDDEMSEDDTVDRADQRAMLEEGFIDEDDDAESEIDVLGSSADSDVDEEEEEEDDDDETPPLRKKKSEKQKEMAALPQAVPSPKKVKQSAAGSLLAVLTDASRVAQRISPADAVALAPHDKPLQETTQKQQQQQQQQKKKSKKPMEQLQPDAAAAAAAPPSPSLKRTRIEMEDTFAVSLKQVLVEDVGTAWADMWLDSFAREYLTSLNEAQMYRDDCDYMQVLVQHKVAAPQALHHWTQRLWFGLGFPNGSDTLKAKQTKMEELYLRLHTLGVLVPLSLDHVTEYC